MFPTVIRSSRALPEARVEALAEQPMTLRLLINEFKRSGTIPSDRCELFERAVNELVLEREERHVSGGVSPFSPAELIEAGERLACFLLLSDQRAVSLGDDPIEGCLRHRDLSALPADGKPLDFELLQSVSRTGLCESDDSKPFSFSHRLFAEYLAGRRLARLPLHQSRGLLASPAGWQAGVAGPLRETAAIAASLNRDLAKWIADTDPEVIGLSNVVDDEMRRFAVLGLLQHCRDHRITDMQLSQGGLLLTGLKYPEAEADVKAALEERGVGTADVLACAIQMVREWRLSALAPDLADIVLDASAPFEARNDAGYVLLDMAPPAETRARLKSLISEEPEEVNDQLKGHALRCNWPDNLTSHELLAALTPPQRRNFFGSYAGFLLDLARTEFDAVDCRVEGLRWAHQQFMSNESDHDTLYKIAQRILHSALHCLEDHAVAEAVLQIIVDCSSKCHNSPLRAIRDDPAGRSDPRDERAPLAGQTEIRRKLIDLLVRRFPELDDLQWIVHSVPHLIVVDDFRWLLERALDESEGIDLCKRHAEFARFLPWIDDWESVELWLQCRDREPIATALHMPLLVDLDSEEARRQRKQHELVHGRNEPKSEVNLDPPPAERVVRMLALAETENPLYFRRVCEQLSLKPDSTYYGLVRFLSASPGWEEADEAVRQRIHAAAQSYLTFDGNDDPEYVRKSPLNSIHTPAIAAIWLTQELSPEWLEAQTKEWWSRWAWFIIRESRLHLSDESNDAKREMLHRLHRFADDAVREHVRRLAVGQYRKQKEQAQSLLSSTLELFDDIADSEMDRMLCARIETGKIARLSVREVAQFVLRRCPNEAAAVILPKVRAANDTESGSDVADLVAALFFERCADHWEDIREYLTRNPQVAAESLAHFASGTHSLSRRDSESPLADASPELTGQLLDLLFEFYPPDEDPQRDGAYFVSSEDEARRLRDRLLNVLSETRGDEDEAGASQRVEALRSLESKYGSRFAWLRRPRARAEREFRLKHRKAIPVASVADVLYAVDKRLIRHDTDALDGVLAAIEILQRNTRQSSPTILNRYWNMPPRKSPTPKEEEFVSDELCLAIRDYFRTFAVVADREVQLFRRKVPKGDGGKSGSVVDLLVSVPAVGVERGSPIVVPIEAKQSYNREALTALRTQLAERYMAETGTAVGVYVLAWFDTKDLASGYRPVWPSIDEARSELEHQALQLREAENLDIKVAVIDLTLR